MGGIPARRTLERWAAVGIVGTCSHSPKTNLHHDHLINEARRELRLSLKRRGRTADFQGIWPPFLERGLESEIFLRPAWVCSTCNEQDAALKGKPGSKARVIPAGMTLCATELEKLANVKLGSLSTMSRKRAAAEVRKDFSNRAEAEIRLFEMRKERLEKAINSV